MNFLAIDTSGNLLTVAAKKGDAVAFSSSECPLEHSVRLMPAVEEVLQKANLTLAECDFIACAVGPGSFTGIRIGISAAKGLAFSHDLPTLPVTTFEVIAYSEKEPLIAAVDAGHGFLYAEGFGIPLPAGYYPASEVSAAADAGGVKIFSLSAVAEPVAVRADAARGLLGAAEEKGKRGDFGELAAVYLRRSSAEEGRP